VLEALEKLKGGMKFPEVAAQYSEDKARQGVWIPLIKHILFLLLHRTLVSHSHDHNFLSLESSTFIGELNDINQWAFVNMEPDELGKKKVWSPYICPLSKTLPPPTHFSRTHNYSTLIIAQKGSKVPGCNWSL